MSSVLRENWTVTEAAKVSRAGIVVAQNARAAEAGAVEGLGLALERFGRKRLAEAMAPAIALAEAGLPLDWHTSLALAIGAAELVEFPSSRAVYLPNGLPPVSAADSGLQHLKLGN